MTEMKLLRTSTFVEDLHRIGRNGESISDIGITSEYLRGLVRTARRQGVGETDLVDVTSEFGPLILVDRMRHVGVGSSNEYLATTRRRCTSRRHSGSDTRNESLQRSTSQYLSRAFCFARFELGDEIDPVVEFYVAGSVEGDEFERFPDFVVGILAGGRRTGRGGGEGGEDSRLGECAAVVDVDCAAGARMSAEAGGVSDDAYLNCCTSESTSP